jgi:hypothetical protein
MLALVGVGSVSTAFSAGGYYVATWGFATAVIALLLAGLWGAGAVESRILTRPTVGALLALIVLDLATAVGALTASNRSLAWLELARTSGYALLVVLVVTLATSVLARRTAVWGVVGMSVAVAAAVIQMLHDPAAHFLYGRLLGPVGYHNGLAMLLVLPLPVIVALAAARGASALTRASLLAAGAFTCCVAVLPLSRGSALFAVIAFAAYFAVAPLRLRSVLALLPVVASVVIGWHTLTAPFDASAADHSIVGPARDAARYAVMAATGAALYGVVWGVLERWIRPSRASRRVIGVAIVMAVVSCTIGGVAVGVDRLGGPSKASRTVVTKFRSDEKSNNATRTSVTNNGRLPLWDVAIRDAKAKPIFGVGGGNWEATYYRDRSARVGFVRQPHSLGLELAAERGLVGLAAFLAFVCAVFAAAWPKIRRGTDADRALATAILAGFAWWLMHAQLDWFWQLASVTMPALVFAGLLLSRSDGASPEHRVGLPARAAVVTASIAALVLVAPLWLSARFLDRANADATDHQLRPALRQLDHAQRWNSLDPEIERLRAHIAEQAGDQRQATASMKRQARLDPRMWSSWLTAARYYDRQGKPGLARQDLARARSLNPLEPALAIDKQALGEGVTDDPFA